MLLSQSLISPLVQTDLQKWRSEIKMKACVTWVGEEE